MELPRLRTWRLHRAMSTRDLAAASGAGVSTINRLEQGRQLARPSTARRLAQALAVRPEDLQEPPLQTAERDPAAFVQTGKMMVDQVEENEID
jgi:transcriptional regulator with XRE-family HTH domain